MSPRRRDSGILVSVDGIDGTAVARAAKRLASEGPLGRTGISVWDASGIFSDLDASDRDAGRPSPRTLLLLYAADLAFRLRWEIRPALSQGHVVIAAPYVETAVAFGRAAGLEEPWLRNLFQFVPTPAEGRYADAPADVAASTSGFLGFALGAMIGVDRRAARRQLLQRARAYLKAKRGRAASARSGPREPQRWNARGRTSSSSRPPARTPRRSGASSSPQKRHP